MKEQTYANHARLLIGFHGITFLAMLALIIGAVMNFINTAEENLYSASLLVLVSFILVVLAYYLRAFALKAQDRAISAEERLRYFILTGKPLSNKLTMRQVIGLRFASDDEFINLVERAEKEGLSEKDIKKAIKNWKADNYRV